jgi:enamine deaminase RidA (YjgF/YER057c/UK114 family)
MAWAQAGVKGRRSAGQGAEGADVGLEAVIAPAGGRLAYISGQGGQDQTGGLSPDFAVQVAQAYASLAAVLQAMGAGPGQVVKLWITTWASWVC